MSAGAGASGAALPAGISLPPDNVLELLLARTPWVVPGGTLLYRAVRDAAFVIPARVRHTHRFGPPEALFARDGTAPFFWLYLAENPITAVFEGRFIGYSPLHPGRFHVVPGARTEGKIATIAVPGPLQLLDLTGRTAALSGLFDVLSSPGYETCQWLGAALDRIAFADRTDFDGFVYPSRRHRGANAIALSSRRLKRALLSANVTMREFRGSKVYRELMGDPLRVPAP